jgi:FtsZ-binding cell division protein ZapB
MQLENCQMKKSFKSMQEELEGLKSENHQLKMSSMDMQERLEEFELENHQLKESSMSIEGQLKNKILLTDHGYKSTAYDIFFREYAILEKGVYTPLYNSETSLLYGNVCPTFEKYNLVERVKHSENGVGYKLTKEGISFYMNNKNKCE